MIAIIKYSTNSFLSFNNYSIKKNLKIIIIKIIKKINNKKDNKKW